MEVLRAPIAGLRGGRALREARRRRRQGGARAGRGRMGRRGVLEVAARPHAEAVRHARRRATHQGSHWRRGRTVEDTSRRLGHDSVHEQGGRHGRVVELDVVHLGLGGKHSLCLVAVTLALAVLLVGVLDTDVLVHEVLAVHVCDGIVRGFKVGVRHKTVALGQACFGVAGDLGRRDKGAEAGEGVVEGFFVHHRIEVADKEFSAHFDGLLLVRRSLSTHQPVVRHVERGHGELTLFTRMGLP